MKSFNKNIILTAFTLISLSYAIPSIAGEKVDESLAISDAISVSIENLSGEVTVTGWNKPYVTVKGELDDKAEKLIFEQVGNTVNIQVVLPNQGKWNSTGSDLVIHMPSKLRMNFEGVSSDIELSNLSHSVTVKTVSGDIQAKDVAQHVELGTVSGNIKTDTVTGKVSLSTVSGDIDDNNSIGRLQLQAVSGEISSKSNANEVFASNISGNTKLNLGQVDELKVSTVSGDNSIKLVLQKNGMVKASSVSGSIILNFQPSIAADFRLRASAGGELVNKITSDEAKNAKNGSRSKLYFQTGNANGSVRIDTVSGDVIIK